MMRTILIWLFALRLMTACTNASEITPTQAIPTSVPTDATPASTLPPGTDPAAPASTESAELPSSAPADDFFAEMGITLPAATCTALTPSQTEGPYYIPNSPERHSLLEEGLPGTRLLLVGYVLDQDCQPLTNAWLDFWQADANGEYDNTGFRLRGHQFTDGQGRYYLETVVPGLYSSRPIEHIHVKVRPEGGAELTSQLYFPARPVDSLTVTLEDRGDYQVGYFNFVVQR